MDAFSLNPDANFDLDSDHILSVQMGFSSFGAQPSSKRRKYNSSTNANISISNPGGRGELAREQRHGEANFRMASAMVGSGRKREKEKVKEMDVRLGINDSEEKEEGSGTEQNKLEEGRDGGENTKIEDTVKNEDKEVHLADDNAAGDGHSGSGGAEYINNGDDNSSNLRSFITSPQSSQLHHEKHKHKQTYQQPNQEQDWWTLKRGVRNEKGDIVYYNNSFVEDPWVGLNVEWE